MSHVLISLHNMKHDAPPKDVVLIGPQKSMWKYIPVQYLVPFFEVRGKCLSVVFKTRILHKKNCQSS